MLSSNTAARHASPAEVRGPPRASTRQHGADDSSSSDSDGSPSSAPWAASNHRGIAQPAQPAQAAQAPPRPPRQLAAPAPVLQHTRPAAYDEPRPFQEYHSGYSDAESALSRPSTFNHTRHQSLTSFLPRSIRERIPSPERRKPIPLFEDMPLTGDGSRWRHAESARGGGGLGSLWGFQSRPEDASPSRASTPDTTPTRLHRAPTDAPTPKSNPTNSGRFAWMASSMTTAISRLAAPGSPVSPATDDELANMDVEAALFPGGPPTERDAFSPAAFRNLQASATGLLLKMQGAYRQRLTALRELEAEREAQREEHEEAVTRAVHLKMQLEGMALRAADQERDMRRLMDELAAERRARAEERERHAREKAAGPGVLRDHALLPPPSEGGSMISEDLGVDEDHDERRRGAGRRRTWRKSNGTVKSDDVSSLDTDEESAESESVFSRPRSPAAGPGGAGTLRARAAPPPALSTPAPAPMSTFQKIIKNISTPREGDDEGGGCRNCRGQDASMAWDTVGLLRDENRALKQRVGQLEVAVEGALDMVNGIGL